MSFFSDLFLNARRPGHTLPKSVPPAFPPAPEALKDMLRQAIPAPALPDWFDALAFTSSSPLGGQGPLRITVQLPHQLFLRWMEKDGRSHLEAAVRRLFGPSAVLDYAWPEQGSQPHAAPAADAAFDDFLPGGRNREALHLFRAALRSSPSFILLRGASGTGKSHLLRAAAEELRRGGKAVAELSFRDLASLFGGQSPAVPLPPSCAILADDIHLLEDRLSVQRELAAFLDAMEGRAFFIAAALADDDMDPGQVLLPELYDRLCSGLVLELAEPDLDVRLRFAQLRMERSGLPEQRDTALLLARRCQRLRHIRGAVEQMRLRYEQSATLPPSGELIQIMGRSGTPQPADVDHILAVVASRYGCSSSQLLENDKDKRLSLPRQIAMFLCREILGESYPALGRIFGGRDHSTIMYAVRKIGKTKVTNKDMHMLLTEMTKQCRKGSYMHGEAS